MNKTPRLEMLDFLTSINNSLRDTCKYCNVKLPENRETSYQYCNDRCEFLDSFKRSKENEIRRSG